MLGFATSFAALCGPLLVTAITLDREQLLKEFPISTDLYAGDSEAANKANSSLGRANSMLASMTTDEKVNMLHGSCMSCPYVGLIPGNARLGIPPLNQHDGPQGFRNEPFATATSTSWPGAMAMAATFDENAAYEWGSAMGKEFRGKGANVQLGPGLNIARVPVNGRNFEYLTGEDPYLGYKLAGPVTKGIQSHNVMACGKHFVGNSQEANRMTVSEDIDERTLFEVYYPPFQGAIDAGLAAIMCSYNRLNGTYSCENPTTLGHLREKLGFRGFVMSDWGATHSPSLKQGLDMEMPVGAATNGIALWINHVQSEEIDTSVTRTLNMMYEIGVMDQPASTWDPAKFTVNVSTPEHIQLARKLSTESTVLLKNEDNVLPLGAGKTIGLIGFASDNAYALAFGHGSGEVKPSHYVSPLQGIKAAAGPTATVLYDSGENMTRAVDLARQVEYAIVFVGASASEGADRAGLSLDGACRTTGLDGSEIPCPGPDANQNELVKAVAMNNPKTIVVASVPGAFLLPWVSDVSAALVNFMPGQEAGNAIADVLFGLANPSAKLPITLPNSPDDLTFHAGAYPGQPSSDSLTHSIYSERLYVGYRHYNALNITFDTGFPFGHGLSYTTFQYSDINVTGRTVKFTVTNVGSKSGREVTQLYLTFPAEAEEPVKQLKGFVKTDLLPPAASQSITMVVTDRDTSIWDVEQHNWAPIHGNFTVHVGSSSRDLRLVTELTL